MPNRITNQSMAFAKRAGILIPLLLFARHCLQSAFFYKIAMRRPAQNRQVALGIAVSITWTGQAFDLQVLAQQVDLFFALAVGANDLAGAEISAPSHARANGLINSQVFADPRNVNVRTG